MKQFRLLTLLALLMTAATGAWATPNSIVINGTPQVGDKSISLTYYFDTENITDFNSGFAPTLKVKCAADNKWDEKELSPFGVSSGTTNISLSTLGEFEAGKTYEVCFAYNNGDWVDAVFQSFVPAAAGYTVSLKDGVKDADKWTVKVGEGQAQALPIGGLKGDGSETVTLQYNGRLKVKGVKAISDAAPAAPAANSVDLSKLTADYEAQDGEVLTGTLGANVKISIADGATVTLKDVNITNLGVGFDWAGISCLGDATLVLEGTNTVCAGRGSDGYNNYPGIWIASGKTLTIQGDGTLTAYSNGTYPYGAGIGGGYEINCGNIVINSGTITATGGHKAAGIGSGEGGSCGTITINGGTVTATGGNGGAGIGGGGDGENNASCGNITISGGTVEATGGDGAAGIGGGSNNGACGTITITKGVTSVTATKGEGAESIGKGDGGNDVTVNIEAGANVTQKP